MFHWKPSSSSYGVITRQSTVNTCRCHPTVFQMGWSFHALSRWLNIQNVFRFFKISNINENKRTLHILLPLFLHQLQYYLLYSSLLRSVCYFRFCYLSCVRQPNIDMGNKNLGNTRHSEFCTILYTDYCKLMP